MGLFARQADLVVSVDGMTCGHCEAKVRDAAAAVPGVKRAEADRTGDRLEVWVDGDVDSAALHQAVEAVGYAVRE